MKRFLTKGNHVLFKGPIKRPTLSRAQTTLTFADKLTVIARDPQALRLLENALGIPPSSSLEKTVDSVLVKNAQQKPKADDNEQSQSLGAYYFNSV